MLDWFGDTFFSLMHAFPAVFTEPNSPNFFLVRAMIGLIAIALIAYLLVFRPYRLLFDRLRQSLSKWHDASRR